MYKTLQNTWIDDTQPSCLCVFDIDRTITAFGTGCNANTIDGAVDNSYGRNNIPLEIAASAANTVEWCKNQNCSIGIATDGGVNMDDKLLSRAGRNAFKNVFAETDVIPDIQDYTNQCGSSPIDPSWCRTKDSPNHNAPHLKGKMTEDMIKKNLSGIWPNNVYFWDDSGGNRQEFCSYLKSVAPVGTNLYAIDPMPDPPGSASDPSQPSPPLQCGLSDGPTCSERIAKSKCS